MAETAGSITVQIGGDISAFEAALAKAKQQAVAFDAQITAQLNGGGVSAGLEKIAAGVEQTNLLLTKLTTSGASAGAALSKVAASTKATTAALTEVAAATKVVNAEMASIGGSAGGAAALGAGTIAAKDFAAALEATGGNLSKITPGMLGLAVANEEVAASSKAAAVGMTQLGVAETEAAGLGAGVTREFSVLGAEVARGNFSRIPGSLIVMNERLAATGASVLTLTNFTKAFGALGAVIFNPYVLGFLALSIGTEVALRGFGALKGGVDEATTALEEHKKTIDAITAAYPEAQAAAKKFTDQAKDIPKALAASNLSNDIVTSVTAMDTALKEVEKTLASPILSGGRSNFDGIGLQAAREFAQLGQELKTGKITAEEYQIALAKISLDPNVTIKAREYARALQDGAAKLIELENNAKQSSVVKDIAVDGQKAQKTLFDVSSGFKDINDKAGSADATIAKLFGTINSGGGGDRFGVTRSLGTQLQSTLGMFQTIDQAVQNSRQNQLAGMVQLEAQLRATTAEADQLKQALTTAGGKDNIRDFFGDVSNIKNANAEIENSVTTVQKLFAALATGNASASTVAQSLDMIRQTLINDGFGVDAVNKFIDSLVRTNQQLVADQGAAHQLNAAIQAIQNKTVTITVVTQQVGTGTKSIYDVGSTGGIGVTRYGGQSDMTQQSYQVQATGGSNTSIGTSGVTVTRFGGARAAGGPVGANTPYWVGEHGPELVVPSSAGSVIPNSQSTALANPQSGFTGRDPTRENERYWTVLMNIEANTRKTAQLLDDIKTAGLASSSGASSSGSSGYSSAYGAGATTAQGAAYLAALATAKANYAAIGGGGLVGYGSNGLGASPEQIAYAAVYGGMSSVGSAGANDYENTLSQTQASMAQSEARRHKAIYGFATGGIDSSDTQKVEFFKNPNEKVIIARPDQFADVRPGTSSAGSASGGGSDMRPIAVHQYISVPGGGNVSKESLAALGRQSEQSTRAALRSVYGR